jgi:hypothetical protein
MLQNEPLEVDMETDASRRRYVRLLAGWAMAPPGDRQAIRALNDPLQGFHAWARSLVGRYYLPALNTLWGATPQEFIDECVQKIFLWAQKRRELLIQLDFTDSRLEGVIRKIARNHRETLRRRLERRRPQSLDSPSPKGSSANLIDRLAMSATFESPGNGTPGGWALCRSGLQMEFAFARKIVPEFGRSLRGEIKMRHLLGLLLRRGRRFSRAHLFPAYWYVLRLLKKRRTHLPKYLQKFLANSYPGVEYKVINTRLGYLRRAFESFCLQ